MDYVEQIPSTDLMYGPGGNLLKVVIVPTPLDAQVIIEAGEYVPVNNVVYVPSETSVIYTVVKNGYISKSETVVVTESQNIYVELEKEQENMIYGWSTGVSKSWSTPVALGNYTFETSLFGGNKYYLLTVSSNPNLSSNSKMVCSVNGEDWKSIDLTSSNVQWFTGLAYGSSNLMLCGDNSNTRKAYYSIFEDGVLGTLVEIEGLYPSNDITYGDGKFVIVGYEKIAVSSNNGSTWTLSDTITGEAFWKVTYGDGRFVAGCLSGKLFVSDDGLNWTEGSQVFSDSIDALTYGNGKFVAWEGKNVSVSEDGINWSTLIDYSSSLPSSVIRACTYGDGKFVAISFAGTLLSSVDGTDWSVIYQLPSYEWVSLCYGNGKFLASSQLGYYSFSFVRDYYSQVEYPVTDDYLFDSDGNIISRTVYATEYKAWEFSKDGINFVGYTKSVCPSSGDTVYSDTSGTTSFTVEGLGTFTLTVSSCDYKSITAETSAGAYTFSSPVFKDALGNNDWRVLTYGNGKFVALGSTGYVSTSSDGSSWSTAVQNSDLGNSSWIVLAYGNGNFVALGKNGHVSVSTDGITWSTAVQSSNLGDHDWIGIAYGKGKFVALSSTGYISTSTDGLNWTVSEYNTDLGNNGWRGLAYNGVIFASIGRDANSGYKSISTDGVNWSPAEPYTNKRYWERFWFDGVNIIGIRESGSTLRSNDGINWTEFGAGALSNGSYWLAVCSHGKTMVALASNGYVSTCDIPLKMKRELQLDETSSLIVQSYLNIADWKIPTRGLPVLDDSDKNEWFGLAYDGYKYVALNKLGYISTSVNGDIWTNPLQVYNLGDTHNWQYLLYDGLKYIALAADGYISTSTDGVTWGSAVSALGAHSWENMAFNGTTYVAVSATGWRATSSDGVNWSNIAADSNLGNNTYYALTYGNGKFVALGKNSSCAYSTNGTSWQKITVSNLAKHIWNGMVWDGTKFLAVAIDGYVTASLDGIIWDPPANTSLASSASEREDNDWDKIIYDGKRLLAVSQEGYVSTGTRVINRNKTLDKVSKNKTQYFTVSTDNSTSITFNSVNNVMTFPNPILIDWGDGSSEIVLSVPSVSHSYSNSGYYRIKITSESGLLPDIISISNLYSWDSILLPMIKADGISYADVCQIFYEKTNLKAVCSSLFKNTMYSTLQNAFLSSGIQSLVLKDKKEVQSNMYTGIGYSSGIRKADFSKLTYATNAFNNAFYNCLYLSDVNFDSLTSVYGNNFSNTFNSCAALTSVVFPVLESIQGSNCFNSAFLNDINLTEVKFPSLKYINGDSVFYNAFGGTAVTDLYFPSLSPVNVNNGQFKHIADDPAEPLKVHFPINLKGKFSSSKYLVALSNIGYLSDTASGEWTPATFNSDLDSHGWVELDYDGTKFVALGSGGYISTSTDGITWTSAVQVSNLGSHEWVSLAYDGTKFVALGYEGYVSTSTDGITWTPAVEDSNLGSYGWIDLTYDNTKFVALGSNGSNGYISTSTDGVTWTSAIQVSSLGYYSWKALAYDSTKFVALTYDGFVSTSTDGITWTPPIFNINLGFRGWITLAYDGTKFVALDKDGYVSTSTDGITWTSAVQVSNLGSHKWISLSALPRFVYDLPPSEE